MHRFLSILTVGSTLGTGLMAGLLFAFSTFLMRAFAGLPADQGMATMQAVNRLILNPWFGLVFGGTTLTCVLLLVAAPFTRGEPGSSWRTLAAAVFLVGVVVVTFYRNVPLNNALAAVDPTSGSAAELWRNYLEVWTRWNHVRTASAIAATLALVLSRR